MADQLIPNGPALAIVQVPDNPTGDPWLNLFQAMVLQYAQPPFPTTDPALLEEEVRNQKAAVLAQFGLHLKF